MQRNLLRLLSISIVGMIGATGVFAQQNYKIKQTVNSNGQNMSNTTYVRGPRKRTENGGIMGMGGDVAMIEQCDLKQYVSVSDKKKKYFVQPFGTGETTPGTRSASAQPKTPVTKGGTLTYTNNITDTGERKQMFGLTARHLKTSMTMESSPDACNKVNMNIQSDGWYVDLPEFSCPISIQGTVPQYQAQNNGGCQDKIVSRSTGGGKLGFPLSVTTTMNAEGGMSFTSTTETVEFSKAPLEASLFDIPQGYTLTSNSQDLYSHADYSAIARAAQQNENNSSSDGKGMSRAPSTANFSGKKIGVLIPNNRGDSLETSNLQSFLVSRLTGPNVMGVAVSSEADARTKGVDYVLSTDITKLKQSTAGKIGGMFGKVTGAPTSGTYDAQLEYRLISLADGKEVLKSKASAKSETEINAAAQNVLGLEASAVLGVVK